MNGIIAVTGGIGAGKTTVLRILADKGHRTLDADHIVHRLYQPGHYLVERCAARWGREILNEEGGIDRRAVAERVFTDPEELAWLNRAVHPEVKKQLQAVAGQGNDRLFCAIPLLFEVGWEHDIAESWAVWCDAATQRTRLSKRGWSEAAIEERLHHQLSMDEKLRLADYGLINVGSMAFLELQIDALLTRPHRG